MARLVEITSGVSVNPEHVASLRARSSYEDVVVRMVDGFEHHVAVGYGGNVWKTEAALREKLNAGDLQPPHPGAPQ